MDRADANMTRQDYEAQICARKHEATRVPFRKVSIGDWSPVSSECHQNVDRWVAVHPECEAVRGWVTYASFGGESVGLTAHSVVRVGGELLDITPLAKENQQKRDTRCSMWFIEDKEDPTTFDAMREGIGKCMICPNFGVPQVTDKSCARDYDESGEDA